MPARGSRPTNGIPSNACAGMLPDLRSRMNASGSMTAGRLPIDSSTPSMTGRLLSCSTGWTSSLDSPPSCDESSPSCPIRWRVRPELQAPPPHRLQRCSSSRWRAAPCASTPPPPRSWIQRLKGVFRIDIKHYTALASNCCGDKLIVAATTSSGEMRSRSALTKSL